MQNDLAAAGDPRHEIHVSSNASSILAAGKAVNKSFQKKMGYPVIMLDKATSALDIEAQATVLDVIHNMHEKRTVIMIAHRLSTVINCEQLFFIGKGRGLASGTHGELLENCEAYRRLYYEECG